MRESSKVVKNRLVDLAAAKVSDLVAALDAVRAEEDCFGASRSYRASIFCSQWSAKTPNPDGNRPV